MPHDRINITSVFPISTVRNDNAIENLNATYFGAIEQSGDAQLPVTADVLSLSDAQIEFFTYSTCGYLALHVKNVNSFFLVSLKVLDSNGNTKTIMVSNNRSTALIMKCDVKVPLTCKDGWQYVCVDLEHILRTAFGVGYASCSEVVVSGSCKLWRVYFQEKEYADCQLPEHLRVGI